MLQISSLFRLLYLEINVFGSTIMFVLILKLILNSRIKGQMYFRRLLTWHIVLFLSDASSLLMMNRNREYTDSLAVFFKSIYFIAIVVITCEAFLYFESCRDSAVIRNPGKIGLAFIPVFLFIVLIILNLFLKVLFYIDADGIYRRGRAFVLIYAICFAYNIVSMIRSYLDAFRRDNFAVRGIYIFYGTYPLIPLAAAFVQFFVPEIPVLCPVLSVSAVIIYVNSMEYLIYLDSLTGLKNRRMIIHNITSMMKNLQPGQELSFTMIDLNNFKSINDRFGHDTGDIALTIIGDAITTCMKGARNRSILYRYGGDEFAIILCSNDSSEIERDLIAIREKTKMLAEERKMPCPITFSAGTSVWNGSDGPKTFIAVADRKMYQIKFSARRGR